MHNLPVSQKHVDDVLKDPDEGPLICIYHGLYNEHKWAVQCVLFIYS